MDRIALLMNDITQAVLKLHDHPDFDSFVLQFPELCKGQPHINTSKAHFIYSIVNEAIAHSTKEGK